MSPIPKKLRAEMAVDTYYTVCARKGDDCNGKITWEHSLKYSGKQIQERWAIIPLCWNHHLGEGLDKRMNEYIAFSRATDEELSKYPKSDFKQKKKYLIEKYGE